MHGHFATYVALKALILKLGGPELPSRWSTHAAGSDSSNVAQQVTLHSQRYRTNVTAAKANGVKVVLVKQAVATGWGNTIGLTYREQVDNAQRTLEGESPDPKRP